MKNILPSLGVIYATGLSLGCTEPLDPSYSEIRARTCQSVASTLEFEETNPDLAVYAEQYKNMAPEDKAKMTWAQVRARLTADDSKYLKLGRSMKNGGILFGVDIDGNPIIADGGGEPIMKGMTYADTRKAVYGEKGDETGYEMFPYTVTGSAEVEAYMDATGKPFVFSTELTNEDFSIAPKRYILTNLGRIPIGKKWRSSWLDHSESYDTAESVPPMVYFNTGLDAQYLVQANKRYPSHPRRGVRRLLRVKD